MDSRNRVSRWDNLKSILIFLVVLGHCIFCLVGKSRSFRILYFYLYIFHVPLFLFTSGMFSRRMIETGKNLKKKVVGYIILGFLLKFVEYSVKIFFGGYTSMSMWSEQGVAWYLFCLAFFILLTRFLRDMPRRTLLVLSVIFALYAGYDKSITGLFAQSRIFVFYPFFLLGTCCDPQKKEPEQGKRIRQAVSVIVLAGIAVFVARNIGWLYNYIDLTKGWNSYAKTGAAAGEEIIIFGPLLRLAHYGAALLMSAAVIELTPSRRLKMSVIGERTLQIYLYHRPLLYVMQYLPFRSFLQSVYPSHWRLLYAICGCALVFLLAVPVLEVPLTAFWKAIGMDSPGQGEIRG